jgi:hypothetical protein
MKKMILNPKQMMISMLNETGVGNEMLYVGLSLENHVHRIMAHSRQGWAGQWFMSPLCGSSLYEKTRDDG